MIRTRSASSRAMRVLILAILGTTVLTCLCGLATLYLLRRFEGLPGDLPLWRATRAPSTKTPTLPTATTTLTASPTLARTQTLTPTPTVAATRTPVATRTRRPTSTPAPTHTSTLTPTPSRTPTRVSATPTPFVCDGLDDLATMQLAPGQRFECTVQEETLTDIANGYPDSPCSGIRVTLDNGEIRVECRMFFVVNATLATRVEDCRLALDVVSGTPGFTNVVQEMIRTQFDTIQYDTICVESVTVDDGQITVSGVGR